MHADPLLVGLDVGTTNIKALIFTPSGAVVAQASTPTPTHTPRPGWATYDPKEIWQAVVRVLREATASVESWRIVSVAVGSMGEAGVPLDGHGEPLYALIAWYDPRTKPQAEWLAETIGKDTLFSLTGLSVQPILGLCKLLWLKENEPEVFAKTVRWLNVAEYVAFCLSGEQATDYSLASRTLALNIQTRRWADEVLTAAGVPLNLYAPLSASGVKIGTVTPAASQQTGLPTSASVATGGHDHVCASFAVGVVQPGMVADSMGTSETIFLALDKALTDPDVGRQGFSQGAHVVPDQYYIFGAVYTSGASMDWIRGQFGENLPHATLVQEADRVSAGSRGVCFLPHLRLASAPYDDPKGRGAFIGLGTASDRAVLYRAVLEGLAYDARNMLEAMLTLAGTTDLKTIIATGGGTRNHLLMRIKSSVMNRPIQISSIDEATCLGAALLGGMGAGIYRDAADALAALQHATTQVEPTAADVLVYETIYAEVYTKLYAALMPLHHRLYAFTQES